MDFSTESGRLKARGLLLTEKIVRQQLFLRPNIPCQNSTCSSISIRSSKFTNFNHLKPTQYSVSNVNSISEMRMQGIILNLVNFYGDIMIKGNTFDSLQFKFENCGIANYNSTDYSNYVWNQSDVAQGKTLFYYNGTSNIQFVNNIFSKCNSVVGLMYLVKMSDDSSILIHNNTFEQNSALLGANTIRIDIIRTVDYNEYVVNYMP